MSAGLLWDLPNSGMVGTGFRTLGTQGHTHKQHQKEPSHHFRLRRISGKGQCFLCVRHFCVMPSYKLLLLELSVSPPKHLHLSRDSTSHSTAAENGGMEELTNKGMNDSCRDVTRSTIKHYTRVKVDTSVVQLLLKESFSCDWT